MKDQQDDNTIVLDLDSNSSYDYGAGMNYVTGAAGSDTITITGGPDTITFDTITLNPAWNSTVNNGGYITSSGSAYTGTTSYSWTQPYSNKVNITGDGIVMDKGADITIGDKSLVSAIEKIEERLGILHPNPELEDRWEQLKALRQQYIDLEKELLEKEKMWKILKEK